MTPVWRVYVYGGLADLKGHIIECATEDEVEQAVSQVFWGLYEVRFVSTGECDGKFLPF